MKFTGLFIFFLILFSTSASAVTENNASNSTNYSQVNSTGILKIITVPVDGAIYLDSQFIGSGLYYNTSFPQGVYRVSFAGVEGYETPVNQTVTVSAGNQTNVIAQYNTTVITPPQIVITKELDRSSISVDETTNVIVKIKNIGTIKAVNVTLNDTISVCAVFVRGERSWSGNLDSGESKILNYEVSPATSGLCILDPSNVSFSDPVGNRFTKFSDEVKITVSSIPSHEPHLVIGKNVDKSTALVDEGVVITLKVKNDGTADALNVTLTDDIPPCSIKSQGENKWNGDMKPEEEKVLTYIVNLNKPGLCSFEAAKASYNDANGNNNIIYSDSMNIYVKEKNLSEVIGPIFTPLIIIGTAVGSLLTIITVSKGLKSKIKKEKKEK
ncbi:Uncharacterised protein [uncultured archaeon]|nr:Uncharacterised protein [uncultured archaeon]